MKGMENDKKQETERDEVVGKKRETMKEKEKVVNEKGGDKKKETERDDRDDKKKKNC